MEYNPRPVTRRARVLFPILATLVVGLLVPAATPLIGMLMLGNLLRESLVVDRLSKSAQNVIHDEIQGRMRDGRHFPTRFLTPGPIDQ